ncbi:MAG: FHA domain-containing protein [Propionibacteriaceae bacterium]|jgi:hypothetical protein|nr:FHA domain-containing protein [Propionibacteriaceae bacterium]
MPTCSDGHQSATEDFCDQCGQPLTGSETAAAEVADRPVAGSAAATEPGPLTPSSLPAPESCPHCGAPRPAGALFCEACGYDYVTGALPDQDLATALGLTDSSGGAAGVQPVVEDTASATGAEAETATEADTDADTGSATDTGSGSEDETDSGSGTLAEPETITESDTAAALVAEADQSRTESTADESQTDGVDQADNEVKPSDASDSEPPPVDDPGSQGATDQSGDAVDESATESDQIGVPAADTPSDQASPEATGGQATSDDQQSPSNQSATAAAGPAEPWVAELWIDPQWYALQEAEEPLPPLGPPQLTVLTSPALIGRRSASRNIHPQIDCGADSGCSRRQAELTWVSGTWQVTDLDSANGTFVAAAGEPLPQTPIDSRTHVGPDDRIYVGGWTRLVVRPATAGEIATLS